MESTVATTLCRWHRNSRFSTSCIGVGKLAAQHSTTQRSATQRNATLRDILQDLICANRRWRLRKPSNAVLQRLANIPYIDQQRNTAPPK